MRAVLWAKMIVLWQIYFAPNTRKGTSRSIIEMKKEMKRIGYACHLSNHIWKRLSASNWSISNRLELATRMFAFFEAHVYTTDLHLLLSMRPQNLYEMKSAFVKMKVRNVGDFRKREDFEENRSWFEQCVKLGIWFWSEDCLFFKTWLLAVGIIWQKQLLKNNDKKRQTKNESL